MTCGTYQYASKSPNDSYLINTDGNIKCAIGRVFISTILEKYVEYILEHGLRYK